jgi:hypothetical protein
MFNNKIKKIKLKGKIKKRVSWKKKPEIIKRITFYLV